ncbi:MAG: glycosyltransferase family 4 protein [Deltaproteobacteria bacterium]|nr:glycosyltransferase family 4 protein [Deltaproteobacteria bacterium]
MRVLMLNTFDEVGGAARAAGRLLRGLRGLGVDARLLVHFKAGHDAGVVGNGGSLRRLARRAKLLLGLLPVRLYPNRPENNFSPALLQDTVRSEVATIDPDVVHLHWLGAGFMRVETLPRLGRPLVWTLHDSWAFTGGCHVPFDCTKYRERCGACPVLGSTRERDLSRWTWRRKETAWRGLDLTVVTPSRWLAECARSSSLFRNVPVEVIPNGIDTETFRPRERERARASLGLPEEKRVILFGAVRGASDPNKGFHLLRPALEALGRSSSDLLAVIFTSSEEPDFGDVGMPARLLGRVDGDERLAEIYSAADVFVAPSLLENLPNTILEAMACGTPCVAFEQGGVPDLVEHEVSGYLAKPYEARDLARGIAWVLEDEDRRAALSRRCREKVEAEFALEKVARRYGELYRRRVAGRERARA